MIKKHEWEQGHPERNPCYCLQTGEVLEDLGPQHALDLVYRRYLLAVRFNERDLAGELKRTWRLRDRKTATWLSGELGAGADIVAARATAEKILDGCGESE